MPVEVDPDHGLWGFFRDKKALPTPEEDHKHGAFLSSSSFNGGSGIEWVAYGIIGRAWTVEELRRKSWEDLQKLWWVCVKERNIMATQKLERKRLDPGYGEFEANIRYAQVCPALSFSSNIVV